MARAFIILSHNRRTREYNRTSVLDPPTGSPILGGGRRTPCSSVILDSALIPRYNAIMAAIRREQRRFLVGGKGSPSKRIRLDLLGKLIEQLQESLQAVADDLGLAPDEMPPAELVDLVEGSAGLVMEQAGIDSLPVPLALVSDAMVARTTGRQYNPILTAAATRVLDDLAALLSDFGSQGYPVKVELSPNGHDNGAVDNIMDDGFVVVNVREATEPEQLDVVAVDESNSVASIVPIASTVPDWLVRFTAEIDKLSRNHEVWLKVGGRNWPLKRSVSPELFAIADSDDARWKTVEVTALAASRDIASIVEVIHVVPATSRVEPEFVPLTEAAENLRLYVNRIEGLSELEQDWDSYGGHAISNESIKAARGFIIVAATQARAQGWEFAPPFIVPVPNGGVQLEWDRDDISLELEFLGSAIEYLRMAGADSVEGPATRARALELVAWLHGGAEHE